jgi:hypothetical protein
VKTTRRKGCSSFIVITFQSLDGASQKKTTLLDATLARKWDNTLGSKAYYDNMNSMEYIIHDQLKIKLDTAKNGQYIKAPVVSRDKIQSTLDSHKSNRGKRTSNRTLLTAKIQPTAPKPKKQKLPAITPGSNMPAKRHDNRSKAMPVLELKPSAVSTPAAKLPPNLEKPLPLNPLIPSLASIQKLLSEQLFEQFNCTKSSSFTSRECPHHSRSPLAPIS